MAFDPNGIHEVEITGCVYAVDTNYHLTDDEFWDAFIDFIESKGWCFGGCDRQIIDAYYIDAQGNPIEEVG